jgi:A/G-specific adenine glycosylase
MKNPIWIEPLCRWFIKAQRQMPWRQTADPYKIWISEVMLQQTQVKTVIEYYLKFTQRFPTIKNLAEANENEVLSLWSGLGYYARARELHRGSPYLQIDARRRRIRGSLARCRRWRLRQYIHPHRTRQSAH